MKGTQEIEQQYQRIIAQEDATRKELAAAEARLGTVDTEDVAAGAQAALEGKPLPARKAIKLKHTVENLRIDLARLDEAVFLLQQEMRVAVGEGRTFPIFVPPTVPSHDEAVAELEEMKPQEEGEEDEDYAARIERQIGRRGDAESIIAEAHRQRELSLDRRMPRLTERPESLSAWVGAAYDAEDDARAVAYEFQARKQRGKDAVAAVQRAKAEHERRGLPAGSFRIEAYPDIVLPEHIAEFEKPIERSPFEKARDARLPSHEPEQNVPVAEAQPVNEADELRKREIAGVPPAAAPDVKPINPDADLPPEERAAARRGRIVNGEEAA